MLIGLFIDMKFAALAWNRGRKHYYITMSNKAIDENLGFRSGDVLGDLEALHEVEPTSQTDRF
jgi:hypothetical protein